MLQDHYIVVDDAAIDEYYESKKKKKYEDTLLGLIIDYTQKIINARDFTMKMLIAGALHDRPIEEVHDSIRTARKYQGHTVEDIAKDIEEITQFLKETTTYPNASLGSELASLGEPLVTPSDVRVIKRAEVKERLAEERKLKVILRKLNYKLANSYDLPKNKEDKLLASIESTKKRLDELESSLGL